MSPGPRPYLAGPEVRRWAPWFLGLLMIAVVASVNVVDSESWGGVLIVLVGLAITAQAVDGLRTGDVRGRFPNRWPIYASRADEPYLFWLAVGMYLVIGVTCSGVGVWVIVSSLIL